MRDLRADARSIFDAALAAVEPRAATRRWLEANLQRADGRIIVVGAGKASAAMAQGVEDALGDRVAGGVIVTKYEHALPLKRIRLMESAHPVPDAAGERGASAIEQAVSGLSERDLVIACVSGGASALIPAPREGLALADKQEVSRLLLASGADIAAVNTVRKKLSRLKGGQLARACAPARVLTLAISDVVGDDWSVIGSGPTSPDPSTFADALGVCLRYGILEKLPPAARGMIERGAAGLEDDTPKPGDPLFARVSNVLLASNRQALDAAEARAGALGYEVVRELAPLTGEARQRGEAFAELLATMKSVGRPTCLLAGGETTVTLGPTPGRGGRNQEFALAAALEFAGISGVAVLSGGTDGTDGPTDAAGGIVDGGTAERARVAKLDAQRHLDGHDAYPLLKSVGDLLVTGPTGTNVMDAAIGLAG
jgi:hydroxypyruvate reductase